MDEHSFYVDLPSDAALTIYPKNHGGEYTVPLPQAIRLSAHQWEVGLAEVVFRQDWQAVIPEDIWVAVCKNDLTGGTYSKCKAAVLDSKTGAKILPTDSIKSIWESALKPLFELALKEAGLWVDGTTTVAATLNAKSQRLTLALAGVTNPDKLPMRLELSHGLLQILGFTRAQLPEEGRYFLIKVTGKLTTPEASHPASLKRGISSLWIYSNIIRPHIAGDTYAPLLRIIGVDEDKGGGTRVVQFDRIHYFNLLSDDISTISILITNSGGKEPIQFSVPVICKLHFRRKHI